MTVILVTGASRGIGAAIAKELAGPDKLILINYKSSVKDAKAVESAVRAKGADCALLKADVSDAKAVDKLFRTIKKRWGRLDILISNAGIPPRYERLAKTTAKEFEAHWKVQALAAYLLCRQAVPMMQQNQSGDIVFVLSSVAQGEPPAYLAPYVSAKYAALGLAKALSAEVAGKGIRVHTIFPGMTETDFIREIPRSVVDSVRESGRLGKPEDAAQAVARLL